MITAAFKAVNDDAITEADQSEVSITLLKEGWLEDYQIVLELVHQSDQQQAFKEARNLLADINQFCRTKDGRQDNVMTKSVQELRVAVQKLALSLALECGEAAFATETSLKALQENPEDVVLWDTLYKAIGPEAPVSVQRIILENIHRLRPSLLSTANLLSLFERIGDYDSMIKLDKGMADKLFGSPTDGIYTSKNPIPIDVKENHALVMKTVHLQDSTWHHFLTKLLALYEDESIPSCQRVRFVPCQEDTNLPSGTLALSFSRRPSTDELPTSAGNTRSSKRKKDNTPNTVKSRSQQYEDLKMKDWVRENLSVTEQNLEKAKEVYLATNNVYLSEATDLLPPNVPFTEAKSIYEWIQWALYAVIATGLRDKNLCDPVLRLIKTGIKPDLPDLQSLINLTLINCYALIYLKDDDVLSALAPIQTYLDRNELDISALNDYFLAHYHHIKSHISANDDEIIYHLNSAKALASSYTIAGPFGYEISEKDIDMRIAKISFKKKLDDLLSADRDETWMSTELFGGADLSSPSECFKSIPEDLKIQITSRVVSMCIKNKLYGKAHRWVNHGMNLILSDFSLEKLSILSPLLFSLLGESKVGSLDQSINSLFWLLYLLLVNESEVMRGPRNALLQKCLLELSSSLAAWKPKLVPQIWDFMAVDGIDRIESGEFLKRIIYISDSNDLNWNALRIINGIPIILDSDFGDPIGSLDMKKPRAHDKLYEPKMLAVCLSQVKSEIIDEAKFIELCEMLLKKHSASATQNTNMGTLNRLFDRDIPECFGAPSVHLYEVDEFTRSLAYLVYKRTKMNWNGAKKRKATVESYRAWRLDLLKYSLPGNCHKAWKLFLEVSVAIVMSEAGSDAASTEERADIILEDLQYALCACNQKPVDQESRALYLAQLFLLICDGPLQVCCAKQNNLRKAFVSNCRLGSGDDWYVFMAFATAAGDNQAVKFGILKSLLNELLPVESFEVKYTVIMNILMMNHDIGMEWLQSEMKRLNLLPHDNLNCERIELARLLGSLDRKKLQHMHQFFIAQIDPSVENWSVLFPFLTKQKSAPFINLWHCDQDLPGMHLVFKAKYTKALLSWLSTNYHGEDRMELMNLACKKICSNLHELVDSTSVIKHALSCIINLKSEDPQFDSCITILKRKCQDEEFISSFNA